MDTHLSSQSSFPAPELGVAVIGAGFMGLPHAAALAEVRHHVALANRVAGISEIANVVGSHGADENVESETLQQTVQRTMGYTVGDYRTTFLRWHL